jgi:hypothetical protein
MNNGTAKMKEVFQQQAEANAQAIWAAFPDVPLPAEVRIGGGYWSEDEPGRPKYYYGGDGLDIEAFFRNVAWDDLVGNTPQETDTILQRFFAAPPPARCWTTVVGDPLLSWTRVTWSLLSISPQAHAYYLPAYLLTALPLLAAMPFEDLPSVEGKADPFEVVSQIIHALVPPPDLDVWKAVAALSPETLGPKKDLKARYAENFLRFIGYLTLLQCHAIRLFVEFTFVTYPLYTHPSHSATEEMAVLQQCWVRPEFA